MTAFRIHAVYLSVIAVLAYALWSEKRTNEGISEQVQKVLLKDYNLVEEWCEITRSEIEKGINANPIPNKQYRVKLEMLDNYVKNKTQLLNDANCNLVKHKNVDIKSIENTINSISNDLKMIINEGDSIFFKDKNYESAHILTDDDLKKQPLLYFQTMKNKILHTSDLYLNYLYNKTVRPYCGRFDKYKVVLEPKKLPIIEGETFEADVYLSVYTTTPISQNTIIQVNGKTLEVKDGIGHYIEQTKSSGLKNMKAQISLQNPATGERTTATGEFEYHVLPKCSVDCNKTQ
jgi:hypothetical protein